MKRIKQVEVVPLSAPHAPQDTNARMRTLKLLVYQEHTLLLVLSHAALAQVAVTARPHQLHPFLAPQEPFQLAESFPTALLAMTPHRPVQSTKIQLGNRHAISVRLVATVPTRTQHPFRAHLASSRLAVVLPALRAQRFSTYHHTQLLKGPQPAQSALQAAFAQMFRQLLLAPSVRTLGQEATTALDALVGICVLMLPGVPFSAQTERTVWMACHRALLAP